MKRYFFIAGVEHESKNGSWVKYEDVAAMQRILKKADEEIRELRSTLGRDDESTILSSIENFL